MTRALATLVLAIVTVGLSACAGACACSSVAPETPQYDPYVGVVIAVDAASLTDIRSFTIRTRGGSTYEFKLGTLENATEFSPSHLTEHMATSAPIRVWYRMEGSQAVAYRLEDAPESPAAT